MWHNVKTDPPVEGKAVVIYYNNTTDIAYYCDNGFYKLTYDDILGVLRKSYVTDKVTYWSNYLTLPISSIAS